MLSQLVQIKHYWNHISYDQYYWSLRRIGSKCSKLSHNKPDRCAGGVTMEGEHLQFCQRYEGYGQFCACNATFPSCAQYKVMATTRTNVYFENIVGDLKLSYSLLKLYPTHTLLFISFFLDCQFDSEIFYFLLVTIFSKVCTKVNITIEKVLHLIKL